MEIINLFEDDDENEASNPYMAYYDFVKVALTINCSDLMFQYSTKPARPDKYLDAERNIEQIFCGYSEPIHNEIRLPKGVVARQPNANKYFANKKIFVLLQEKKNTYKSNLIRLHHLRIEPRKNKEPSITFDWHIDDRSLFTRICFMKTNSTIMHLTFRINAKEAYFKNLNSIAIENKNETEKEIFPVEDLQFHFE